MKDRQQGADPRQPVAGGAGAGGRGEAPATAMNYRDRPGAASAAAAGAAGRAGPAAAGHRRGLARLVAASRSSLRGLRVSLRNEAALRLELWVAGPLAPVGWWLGEDSTERILLLGSLALVVVVELLNTAIENTVDRIGPERHELSGRAKDAGSAAVFVAIGLAAFTWVMVLAG